MRAAQRVVAAALPDPAEGQVGGHRAVHDPEPGQVQQRLQPRTPTWSWKAASATVVTPARTSRSSTPKKTGSVLAVSSSPGRATKPEAAGPQMACTIPSLISSRQMAGHPTAEAIAWASVVLPEPAGPLTMMSVGRGDTLAVIADGRNIPGALGA